MDVRTLAATDMPGTPEWKAIADLLSRRAELSAAVDKIDADQREASRAVEAAATNVADLERRALGGQPVSADQRRKAEQELTKARARVGEPWSERRKGAAAAIRDADAEIEAFVRGHFDALRDGLYAQGAEAAETVDRAAADLVAAHAAREDCARRLGSLASVIARTRPGDVSGSRSDVAAREAEALLTGGGERPPELRHDPRTPRHAPEAIA